MYVLGLEGVEVFKIEKSLIQNFASALGAVEISTLDGDTQSVCFEESAPLFAASVIQLVILFT